MSYAELYAHCQSLDIHIGRNVLRDKVLQLTGVNQLRVVRSGLDTTICRGMFLSARNTTHRIVQQMGCNIIVLPRDGLDRGWERFVFVKELMHLFDDPEEATDSGDEFEKLLTELSGGAARQLSPQTMSEVECFWFALAALCPEPHRQRLGKDLQEGRIDDNGVAAQFLIPQQYVSHLYSPTFEQTIGSYKL